MVGFGHTLGILAGELGRAAGAILAVAIWSFIGAIATVVVVVAGPVAVNTPAIPASELLCCARVALRAIEGCRVLVGSVHAVGVTITNPFFRDALRLACTRITICNFKKRTKGRVKKVRLPHCLLALHANSVSASHLRLPH